MIERRDFLRTALGAALLRPRWRPLPGPVGQDAATGASGRRALYVFGYFSGTDMPMVQRAVNALGASVFNVLILAFLHVRHTAGALQLLYNTTKAGAWSDEVPGELQRLRSGFPIRKRLLISIGGWGHSADFEAIRAAGVERFLDALDQLVIGPLGLDGIDLDLEPGHLADNTPQGWRAVNAEYGGTLVALTNGYMRRHPQGVVTHAPIASVAASLYARDGRLPGVPGGFFAACRGPHGNRLAWINIQLYESGDLDDGVVKYPGGIAGFWRRELLTPLQAASHANGLADPSDALLPGFEPHEQKLNECAGDLNALRAGHIRVPGFFLWQYGQIAPQMAAWERLGD